MRILDSNSLATAIRPLQFAAVLAMSALTAPREIRAQRQQDLVGVYASAIRAVQRKSPPVPYALLVVDSIDGMTARSAAAMLHIPVVAGSARARAGKDTVTIQVLIDSISSTSAFARVVMSGHYSVGTGDGLIPSWFTLYRAVLSRQKSAWVVDSLKTEMES